MFERYLIRSPQTHLSKRFSTHKSYAFKANLMQNNNTGFIFNRKKYQIPVFFSILIYSEFNMHTFFLVLLSVQICHVYFKSKNIKKNLNKNYFFKKYTSQFIDIVFKCVLVRKNPSLAHHNRLSG